MLTYICTVYVFAYVYLHLWDCFWVWLFDNRLGDAGLDYTHHFLFFLLLDDTFHVLVVILVAPDPILFLILS